MTLTSDLILTKTPQGVNATRSGVGLSPKAYTMLKLFDGSIQVSGFKKICLDAAIPEADFQPTLTELLKFDHLRALNDPAADTAASESAAERRMLLTLDFTAADGLAPRRAVARSVATPLQNRAAAAPTPAMAARTMVPQVLSPNVASQEVRADAPREERTVQLKRENEIRQKLVTTLQPRVEEELRARLRPKLEQELRPKLIAALRPGLEAEVRTALIKELTPRVELELKARFAKTMAAQKAADQPKAEPQPVVVPIAEPIADAVSALVTAQQRLLACMSIPLFSLDKTGVCNYVSPAWAQFSGHAVDDLVGKHMTDFFADQSRKAVAALLTGVSNGTALRFEQQGELLRKDADPLWVEIAAAPLTAADGTSLGVCGSLRDATEMRRTADQAEADGVRLLLLVEQIATGVILEDSEGNIQQANPALCALLSLDAAAYSLEGMPVTELFERASRSFIGPDGFLHRVSQMRAAEDDTRGESFVMADGRVLELDYLMVSTGDHIAGRVWLFQEMQRSQISHASQTRAVT